MKFIEFADCIIPISRIKSIYAKNHEPWLDEETGKTYGHVDLDLNVFDDHPGYVEEFYQTEYDSIDAWDIAVRARWGNLLKILNSCCADLELEKRVQQLEKQLKETTNKGPYQVGTMLLSNEGR